LGKWKLEYDFKEAVFLGPKVYGGILRNKKEIVKVKGFKNLIKFKDLKTLLNKNSFLNLNLEKWFRNLSKGEITIKNQIYKLTATENKRAFVYKKGKIIGTKPFVINNKKEIIS
jgi:predicted lipoprotein